MLTINVVGVIRILQHTEYTGMKPDKQRDMTKFNNGFVAFW